MSDHRDTTSEIPIGKRCGAYRPGHDMHFIQARLSAEDGPGAGARVLNVADDGTITLDGGLTLWHHDPDRLRLVLERFGHDVLVCGRGVLRVPHDGGAYCFCVADAPDPCRADTGEPRPGESLVEELQRRGGFLRRVERTTN